MSPSLELLLSHYRRELAATIGRSRGSDIPDCPPGEELLWAEVGESAGWVSASEAMEIRRLATRVHFYERRASEHLAG